VSVAAQKKAGKIVGLTMLCLLVGVAALVVQVIHYPNTAAPGPTVEAKIIVERGTSLREIARRLGEHGLIRHPSWFRFYANERGLAQKIKAGQYTLSSSMTPTQILDHLIEGVPIEEVAVTLPEGKNLVQIAELFDQAGICAREDFERIARDAAVAQKLGVPGPTLEGYLYPDTYKFPRGTQPMKIVSALVRRSKDVFAELASEHAASMEARRKIDKVSARELVLMASLVEKETASPEERPRIAGVFYNRLRLPSFVPHVLQTDPTIVYGCTVPKEKSAACAQFDTRIRRIQLDDKDNAYNTYTHAGLPPGPISNPGRAALLAAIEPDQTPYLYFVSKNDGTHYFSKTVAEHEAAVDKYQRGK
jgi:UPF0755 protein